MNGLGGMSLSQVADALDIPKSSVQVAYRHKEDLQLATVQAATRVFFQHVVAPAFDVPEGLERLEALLQNWVTYIDSRVLPGGCFMSATFAEYDSKPGPVRDALAESRHQWLYLIEQQAAIAQQAGSIPESPSAELLAFEIDALLAAANVARNLHDDDSALETAQTLIQLRLST